MHFSYQDLTKARKGGILINIPNFAKCKFSEIAFANGNKKTALRPVNHCRGLRWRTPFHRCRSCDTSLNCYLTKLRRQKK